MSQIDLINYMPHLMWFLILFCVFYVLIFSQVLPLIFTSMRTRVLFFNNVLFDSLLYDILYYFNILCINHNGLFILFVKSILFNILHTHTAFAIKGICNVKSVTNNNIQYL